MAASTTNWWERTGTFIAYPNLQQGNLPHCVYAAIAGGINHLAQRQVWTPQLLYKEYQKNGPRDAHFGVADTALEPVANEVEKHQHHKDTASVALTPKLIRGWIDENGVVILSMELRNDSVSKEGRWHMFSLMTYEQDRFQVWDTNGFQGFLTDEEIIGGFYYPGGLFFMPHDKEDTLVLKRKQ